MDKHFEFSPEMFVWVQVSALAGPLKDIHRVVPKPLLLCLGCVLRVIVLLVFIKYMSYICPSTLTGPQSLPLERHTSVYIGSHS